MATVIMVPKYEGILSLTFDVSTSEQPLDAGFVLNWHGGRLDPGHII